MTDYNLGGIYDIEATQVVYDLLVDNIDFLRLDKKTIFQHNVPEEFHSGADSAIIRISFINQVPESYADNLQLSWFCVVQIDVWHESDTFNIASKINHLMKSINFKQSSPIVEYDEDTYLMRDGRRYEGIIEADKNMIIEQLKLQENKKEI